MLNVNVNNLLLHYVTVCYSVSDGSKRRIMWSGFQKEENVRSHGDTRINLNVIQWLQELARFLLHKQTATVPKSHVHSPETWKASQNIGMVGRVRSAKTIPPWRANLMLYTQPQVICPKAFIQGVYNHAQEFYSKLIKSS